MADPVSRKEKSTGKHTAIHGGIIDVIECGGILEVPKFRQEYTIDEIERIADQSESVVIANLWSLACNVVFDSVAKDEAIKEKERESANKKKSGKKDNGNVGKDMRTSTRCILYTATMKDCIENYPLRSDGAIILRYFGTDNYDKPVWPDYFFNILERKNGILF
jgi:hypothetical protein